MRSRTSSSPIHEAAHTCAWAKKQLLAKEVRAEDVVVQGPAEQSADKIVPTKAAKPDLPPSRVEQQSAHNTEMKELKGEDAQEALALIVAALGQNAEELFLGETARMASCANPLCGYIGEEYHPEGTISLALPNCAAPVSIAELVCNHFIEPGLSPCGKCWDEKKKIVSAARRRQ